MIHVENNVLDVKKEIAEEAGIEDIAHLKIKNNMKDDLIKRKEELIPE